MGIRYDLFGWDYAGINPLGEDEAGWYETWARRTGGPVLALACGAGRLLCRLARAGFDVTGLDLSKTMLGFACAECARQPAVVRRRVRLVRGDMAGFALGRRFGLALIADNSFRELATRRQLLACLRCIRQHLLPEGRLLITERRFDPSKYHNNRRSFGWSQPIPHPRTGRLVSRRGEFRLAKDGRRMRGRFVYRIAGRSARERIVQCPMSVPILTPQEYGRLFAMAGFDWRLFVGYKEVADDGTQPILCFVCTLR